MFGTKPAFSCTWRTRARTSSGRSWSAGTGKREISLAMAMRLSLSGGRAEAVPRVAAVAERLVLRSAAAAEARAVQAIDRAAGAGADLAWTGDDERSVGLRADLERTPVLERLRGTRGRLAGGGESGRDVRAVAEGLVAGCAAPAQGGAEHRAAAGQPQVGVDGVRPVLADSHHVARGERLWLAAVEALVGDGAGRAGARDRDEVVDRSLVRVEPGADDVGGKDAGRAGHAMARVDAAARLEAEDD